MNSKFKDLKIIPVNDHITLTAAPEGILLDSKTESVFIPRSALYEYNSIAFDSRWGISEKLVHFTFCFGDEAAIRGVRIDPDDNITRRDVDKEAQIIIKAFRETINECLRMQS